MRKLVNPFAKLARRFSLMTPRTFKKILAPLKTVRLKKAFRLFPVKPATGKKNIPAPRQQTPTVQQRVATTWPYANLPASIDSTSESRFLTNSYSNHAGRRSYRLYAPRAAQNGLRPLIVMLHGCTQSAQDFVSGTRMPDIAGEQGCYVAYPEQSPDANRHGCWNWFKKINQSSGEGEPSIIAGITQQIIQDFPIDPARVYIAGLSAGGAMAVATAYLYPDMFAAVGSHSGLPFGLARNLPAALAVMNTGMFSRHFDGADNSMRPAIPIIVVHGDQDRTVNPANGEQLIEQFVYRNGLVSGAEKTDASSRLGTAPGGRSFSVTTYMSQVGQRVGEYWQIHGLGHAWSGGSAAGTYTDPLGPDASREMLRFFLLQKMPVSR